jgi:hypothetical protein
MNEYAGIRDKLILDAWHAVEYKMKYDDFLAAISGHFDDSKRQ